MEGRDGVLLLDLLTMQAACRCALLRSRGSRCLLSVVTRVACRPRQVLEERGGVFLKRFCLFVCLLLRKGVSVYACTCPEVFTLSHMFVQELSSGCVKRVQE